MTELCVVCGSRRGQRDCAALSNRICSQCCGRGRRRTIDCPDGCRHFLAGARQAVRKLAEQTPDLDFNRSMADVMHNLRLALVRIRGSRAPDLTDGEARLALLNAADTMRTRSRGLVYDFRSPDPRIQWVTDEVLTVADRHEQGENGLRRATAAELSTCLRHLEHQARQLMGDRPEGTAFLDLVVQSVGRKYMASDGRWLT